MPATPVFIIADDHPMFRAAIAHSLMLAFPEAQVIETASQSALEASLADDVEVDLVLLDLTMPGAVGFSALLWLRAEHPDLPVMVISSNDRPRTVQRAEQFGAAGFVSKAAPMGLLAEAVTQVLAGGSWFEETAAALSEEDAQLAQRLAQLTPQQFRVLLLLAEGLLNKQIADRLSVSENTVKVHVKAILAKLACRSRTQAAVLVKSLDLDA